MSTEPENTTKAGELQPEAHIDAVPGNDKAHAHSHAAHLQPEANIHLVSGGGAGKQGREPGTLREPPQDPKRNGKGHGRQ